MPITLVQTVGVVGSTTSPTTAAISVPANGNLLCAITGATWSGSGGQPVVSSITGGGGTWVNAATAGSTNRHCEIWYAPNVQSGGTLVTVNWTGSANTQQKTKITEWSGLATSLPLDQAVASSADQGPTTSATTVSVTTLQAVEVVIAGCQLDDTSGHSAGPTNGFTEMTGGEASGGDELFCAYQIVSSVGTYSTGWTIPVAVRNVSVVASFMAPVSVTYGLQTPTFPQPALIIQTW
jgi:hypothetical protein